MSLYNDSENTTDLFLSLQLCSFLRWSENWVKYSMNLIPLF